MRLLERTPLAVVGLAAVAAFALTGCTMAESENDSVAASQSAAPDASADLVGAGCDTYREAVPEGAASFNGMAQSTVATAAADNPLLTNLAAALSGELNPEVNLVETLNGDEYTVFAPVDSAFAAFEPATLTALEQPANAELLSGILSNHLVEGQLAPDEVAGTHITVEGGSIEVTGSGDELQVGDTSVICGGIHTSNATVYLIDGILLPS